jgi:hypothetical protein
MRLCLVNIEYSEPGLATIYIFWTVPGGTGSEPVLATIFWSAPGGTEPYPVSLVNIPLGQILPRPPWAAGSYPAPHPMLLILLRATQSNIEQ